MCIHGTTADDHRRHGSTPSHVVVAVVVLVADSCLQYVSTLLSFPTSIHYIPVPLYRLPVRRLRRYTRRRGARFATPRSDAGANAGTGDGVPSFLIVSAFVRAGYLALSMLLGCDMINTCGYAIIAVFVCVCEMEVLFWCLCRSLGHGVLLLYF